MSLLTDLDAFFTDHLRCGELDAGVDGDVVWIACDCGARIARRVDGMTMADRPTGVSETIALSQKVRADARTIVAMSRVLRARARRVVRSNKVRDRRDQERCDR